jgi:2-iminoacetate synthase
MSAGSKTEPGGYVSSPDALEQFTITDGRTPHDVVASISAHGYEPVWKDWDAVFDTVE